MIFSVWSRRSRDVPFHYAVNKRWIVFSISVPLAGIPYCRE